MSSYIMDAVVSAVSCIHRRHIWQCPIVADLQDMHFDLSESDLSNKAVKNLAAW